MLAPTMSSKQAKATAEEQQSAGVTQSRLLHLMLQPRCVVAVAIATAAHTAMVLLMGALSIAMANAGYSRELSKLTLEAHFFCMFAPGGRSFHNLRMHVSCLLIASSPSDLPPISH